MVATETFYWDDIGFAARVEFHEVRIEFKVTEIVGWGADSSYRVFPIPKQEASHETTADLASAAVFYEGQIMFDGCSNVVFPGQSHCMLHFCGFNDFRNFFELNRRLFKLVKERLEYTELEDLE